MKLLLATFLAGTALAVSGTAMAADMVRPRPSVVVPAPAAKAWSWTGVHFGIGGGIQWDRADAEAYSSAYVGYPVYGYIPYFASGTAKGSAGFLTIDAGYDHQVGSLVFGIFANYDWHPSKASGTISEDSLDLEMTWGDSWAVGGRLGFLITPRTLLYGVGGVGQKEIRASFDGVDDSFEGGGWQFGWFAGAGIETMLTKNLSLKGEYRYARYNGFSESGFDDDFEIGKTTSQTVRGVLSFRFGN